MNRKCLDEYAFLKWKNRIETHVIKTIHISLDDLYDEPYRYWFESTGMSPLEVSKYVIERYNHCV